MLTLLLSKISPFKITSSSALSSRSLNEDSKCSRSALALAGDVPAERTALMWVSEMMYILFLWIQKASSYPSSDRQG